MLVGVISDVHANVQALRLVMADMRDRGVEKVVCLGDLVGFHTHPGECIDLLRSESVFCILGNHDAGVIGKLDRHRFPVECWDVIEWTRGQLSSDQLQYLSSLPNHTRVDGSMWLMHGYFRNVTRYLVGNIRIALAGSRLRIRGIRLGFYGHTHHPKAHVVDGTLPLNNVRELAPSGILTNRHSVYLCNPGTVGQPRTADACTRYLTFDSEGNNITFHRIEYDYAEVVNETLSHFPRHASFYDRFQESRSHMK
jgi:predicted phosphodiesterase